jgi:hypothetical protein
MIKYILISGKEYNAVYQQIGLKFKNERNERCIWSVALCDAEGWTLRKADQKFLKSLDLWFWRTMGKISWTNCVKNEKVLLIFNEEIR